MVSGISLVQWFNVYPEFTCVYNLLGVPVINRRVKQSCVVPGRFLVVCLHVYAFVCMFENFARVHVCVTWCKSCGYPCCGVRFQFPHLLMLLLALSASQLRCQISGKVRMTHCSGQTIRSLAFSIYIKGLCHFSHYMSISIGTLLPCLQLNHSPFSQQYSYVNNHIMCNNKTSEY